jgi:hypothetical protein
MPAVTCPRCGSKDTYRIEERAEAARRGGNAATAENRSFT